jgi:hypothetical protein
MSLTKPSEFLAEAQSIVSDYDNKIIEKELCITCLRNLHYFACQINGNVSMTIRDMYQSIK